MSRTLTEIHKLNSNETLEQATLDLLLRKSVIIAKKKIQASL